MRTEVARVRAEVSARLAKTSGNPGVFDVHAIAADLRRLHGSRVAVARLRPDDFWYVAGKRRVQGEEQT